MFDNRLTLQLLFKVPRTLPYVPSVKERLFDGNEISQSLNGHDRTLTFELPSVRAEKFAEKVVRVHVTARMQCLETVCF